MKPLALEWIEKAEGDFAMMEREARAKKSPCFDGLCFHAQQCVEKYLKACLCEKGIAFPKTHNLVSLLDLIVPSEPLLEAFRSDLAILSGFSTNYRYPGDSADKLIAKEARLKCRGIRGFIRKTHHLPLPNSGGVEV